MISKSEFKKSQKFSAIQQIIKRCESLPVIDERTPDEILGYEQSPSGLWGDCCSYAIAKYLNQSLLFKGDDFSKTDIQTVT
ncbi:type II toxin-antitoxin system VapC family toxin [Synechocystis sp. PCC 7509]|uniref:type II toxin-antitoxin system VapC family toxin n=1 Tax=Synechocystis sp. PCC 7509 TaxID=927677 RepID=UPI0002ACF68C|nr:type II toxin-antitoxin system VapC family toxin [Synechocystis sp. PCC 7509]